MVAHEHHGRPCHLNGCVKRTDEMRRGERAIYVHPQLAHDLYGVHCTQAFLVGLQLFYLTPAGHWITALFKREG